MQKGPYSHSPNLAPLPAYGGAALEANPALFSQMVQAARPQLFAMALRRTRSTADAEDAVQETFLKAWKTIAGFRGEAKFSTWLTRILLNEIHQLQRRRDYRDLGFQDSLLISELQAIDSSRLPPGRSPEQELVRTDALQFLHHAIASLPKALRQVLQLEVMGEKTCAEIAQQLGISLPAAKSRRLRARMELLKRCSVRFA